MKTLITLAVVFSIFLFFILFSQPASQAQTIFFEDFEKGQGDWYSTGSDWQIGIPTSGPDTAYSGQNLAATNLSGNYSHDANTKLVSPIIQLPQVADGERLQMKFKHWYYILNGQGRLQVAKNPSGQPNWQTLPMDTSFQGLRAIWTQYVADLTAYAGSKIRFAFWFTSGHGGKGERAGWYLDDILIEKTNTQMPNPESFEDGIGDWSATNGDWQAGPYPNFGPKIAHSGQNVVGTNLNSKYSPDANTKLISPPLKITNLAAGKPIWLRFWHWYHILYGEGKIQVSVNNGAWITVPNSHTFNGYNSVWTHYITKLSPLPGLDINSDSIIRLAFWFTSNHGGQGEKAGWYLDDIYIQYTTTGIPPSYYQQPLSFELYPAFPNPFNASTTIQYYLPSTSHISLEIYNANGQLVAVLTDKVETAGLHSFVWNATDNHNNNLPSGIYLCCLKADNFSQTKKLILLK